MFNIHDPIGLKILFQLRVGLSPLKNHKKRHKFKDTPTDSCLCQMSSETTVHFLIYCSLYTEARNVMFQVINTILDSNGLHLPNDDLTVQILLYGDESLSEAENTAVLNATLNFIHKSSRFILTNG